MTSARGRHYVVNTAFVGRAQTHILSVHSKLHFHTLLSINALMQLRYEYLNTVCDFGPAFFTFLRKWAPSFVMKIKLQRQPIYLFFFF